MPCCSRYRCVQCGKEAPRLSESWSTVSFPDRSHIHRCLECRSQGPVTR